MLANQETDQAPQSARVKSGVDLAKVDGEEQRRQHRRRPEGEVEQPARQAAVVEVHYAAHDGAQLR